MMREGRRDGVIFSVLHGRNVRTPKFGSDDQRPWRYATPRAYDTWYLDTWIDATDAIMHNPDLNPEAIVSAVMDDE